VNGGDADRRSFLRRLGVAAVLGTAGVVRPGSVGTAVASEDLWTGIAGLPSEITPVGRFYTVSKNVFDPAVNAARWTLTVKGRVERPYRLTLDEVRHLPAVTRPHTLMCISNEVGGDLISNAVWKGVALRTVLERAGLASGARKLILRARDGYAETVPVATGLRDGTLLAYEMNGAPLERQHGFPVRALVMGLYGIKNVKWLTEIEVVDHDYKGYWAARGWTDTAHYKTFSRIDAPPPTASVRRGTLLRAAGVAFAGDRGVSSVHVSVDGGASWQPARVKPALGDHTWVLWAFEWVPAATGIATLAVRAVDGTGASQSPGPKPPLPDGVEGFHGVSVHVSERGAGLLDGGHGR
jgi:DMSO/TMAO reductase YedYZ molybdopterin-dependent catalytic subunit